MSPIHPKIVHFPIALLLSATLFAIVALVYKSKRDLFKNLVFWNLLLGTLSSVLTILSGLFEEKTLVHNSAIHSILETHKTLGIMLTIIFIMLTVWFIFRKMQMKNIEFVIITLVMVFSSILLGYTSHIGGKMVYEEGAGIIPMEKQIIESQSHTHDHHSHDH